MVALFTNEVEERQRLRNFVREQLPQALADSQISVHYQPVLDARTGLVQSAEALVRWRDPVRGFISPAEFIPLAEETGQVVELGSYVLQQACCEAAGWLADARGHVPDIAVNVSAAQLLGGVLVSQVDAALLLSGLPPHRLAVELTETDLATATDSLSTLQAIRERGVRVKIDDFGTGYSSFGYLTRFPVDCVKIDKSFVDRIVIGESDAAITAAIIVMAYVLKIDVIAEGVEQREQADVLTSQGCDGLQGYLFSKPLAALDFQSWLADRHMAELANMEPPDQSPMQCGSLASTMLPPAAASISPTDAAVTAAHVEFTIPGNHLMVALLGHRDAHLRIIEQAFPDHRIVVRGNQVVIDGESSDQVGKLFSELVLCCSVGRGSMK